MSFPKRDPTVYDRIHHVETELKALTADVLGDEKARKMLIEVSQHAINSSELGPEGIWRILMQPHQSAALRTALEMGLIETLIKDDVPRTATELANKTGGDKLLIVRILRPLAAMNVVIETDYETYKPGLIAKAFAIPPLVGGFKFMFDEAASSCVKLPEFLAQKEFQNPQDPQGVFQYAHSSPLHMFQWLQQHPKQMSNFNTFMGGQRHNRIDWFDSFPMDEIIFQGYQKASGAVLLIDIAGGRGYDLEAFKERFPDADGQLILQELPDVIDEVHELRGDIRPMKYDFFTPQPVNGARVYYFRSIFHDWPDHKCRQILQNTVSAMTPGYSKLLINEWVLPDVAVPLYPALLDINMMALLSGMERTKTQWTELLDSVGLEVVKFWTIGAEAEGLIEAVRKD